MNRALIREWMAKCATCTNLITMLNEVVKNSLDLHQVLLFRKTQTHLMETHPTMLPDYADDCMACQEWKAVARGGEFELKDSLTRILGPEDFRHRAGHLLYYQEE